MKANTFVLIAIILGIAAGVTTYRYVLEDDETPQKTFAVTALIGAIVTGLAMYFLAPNKPKISSEPFQLDAPAVPVMNPPAAVPMPTA